MDTIRRVVFIKRAQTLGFTLEEIDSLLALRVTPGPGCATVENRARLAITRLDRHFAELQHMRRALAQLADACRSQHPTNECPLLDAIEPDGREGPDGRTAD